MKKDVRSKKLLGMYERMVLIRKYEERIYYLFLEGAMPGSIHQSHGQEASAVGILYDLRDDDYMGSTHRPAGHDLAKGVSLKSMMCEMFAKANGCCGAKGGAMHTGDITKGVIPANAIVAGNMPIMVGIALGAKMRGTDQVAVSYFGDGATNEGAFHEALNGAAIWKAGVIFVCENNLYGASTPIRTTCLLANPAADRGPAYGIPSEVVDGNDVIAVNEAMDRAVSRARAGEGPTILELKTYRIPGHSRSDACAYRTREEEAEWAAKDPIKRLAAVLVDEKVATAVELEAIDERIEQEVEDSVEFAKNSPDPKPEDAFRHVYWEERNN
ncbi:MAG: thiamine pyrophosphate-dependent dehydrogenase E1 component subunit alpha [Planctomycetaceae bacterium]|nr:thiamine pyrophosphate-dependent dehydrogenase E1 component subunit alpha [Planctomycetaceae bacterium]